MAPEVHDTAQPKTNRVDIWSLGCILYRMVAGSPLFKDLEEEGGSGHEVLGAVL